MKTEFIIAIAVVGMLIGVIPNVLGATYLNDPPNDFSINYPDEWIVVEPSKMDEFEVGFDNKDDWTTRVTIYYFEGDWSNTSDKQIVDVQVETSKNSCLSESFTSTGTLCTDFQYHEEETKVYLINGYRAEQI